MCSGDELLDDGGLGCGVIRAELASGDAMSGGAENAEIDTHGSGGGFDEPGGRGLAVGSRDTDHRYPLGGMPGEGGGRLGECLSAVCDLDDGHAFAGLDRAIGDDCSDVELRNESAAIDLGSADGDEDVVSLDAP